MVRLSGRCRRPRVASGAVHHDVADRASMIAVEAPLRVSVKIREPATKRHAEDDREGAHQQPQLAASRLFQLALSIGSGPVRGDRVELHRASRRFIRSRTSSRSGSRSSSTTWPSARKTHPVGVRRGHRVVGDHHDGLAELVDAAPQQARAPPHPTGVEVAGRLVGEDDRRLAGERARARRRAAADRRRARWAGGRAGRAGPTVSITVSYQSASGLRPAIDSGSRMFSSAVSVGTRLKDWKTKPIWSRRSRVSALSLSLVSSVSPTYDLPLVGGVQRGAAVHQRRLARARGPHHGGELARDAGRG